MRALRKLTWVELNLFTRELLLLVALLAVAGALGMRAAHATWV